MMVIYKIINTLNFKLYVGSAINAERRKHEHFRRLFRRVHENSLLQNAWNKYGCDNFKFIIIEIVEEKDKLIEREQYWINLTKSANKNFGYNLKPIAGSNLGLKTSEETKAKISASLKGFKHSQETIEKFKNREFSEQTRKLMSISQSKRTHPIETKLKISNSHKGKTKSEDHKFKLSLANLGQKHSQDRINRAVANQKLNSSWQHPLGRKCSCEECKERKRKYKRIWRLTHKG